MKTVTVETHDLRQLIINHVTEVVEKGDFMVVTVANPNGQTEIHRFATYTIQRLSYYDKTAVMEDKE